jgi:hypothetical protein
VGYGLSASWFRLSRPCLAALRSVAFENREAEDRRPIVGRGMISENVL